MKKEKESIEDTIKNLKEKFGADSIIKLNQKPLVGLEAIPTGSLALDQALGIGGFPRGRIVEIFGFESSGKTTLALHVVAEAQKKNLACAYVDVEHAMDPQYAKALGVNTGELFLSQPGDGEIALNMVEDMVRSHNFGVIVVDSVAMLTPKAEIEGDMDTQHVGRQARLMGRAMRKLVGIIEDSNAVVIFINQLRMTISTMPFQGEATFTPGGKALKFCASVRIEMKKLESIKDRENTIGSRIRARIVKSKVSPPFVNAEFEMIFGKGISKEGEILEFGEKTGVLEKKGHAFFHGETKLGAGQESARLFLQDNKEISEKIYSEIKKKLSTL